jgi:hypothetical protein
VAPVGPKRSSRTPPRDGAGGNGTDAAVTEEPAKPKATGQPRRVKRKKGGARR